MRKSHGYMTRASKARPIYGQQRLEDDPACGVPRVARVCLKCGVRFDGVGKFNRLCQRCNHTNAAIAGRGE